MDRRMIRRKDGQIDGRMDTGQADGRMDRQMEVMAVFRELTPSRPILRTHQNLPS